MHSARTQCNEMNRVSAVMQFKSQIGKIDFLVTGTYFSAISECEFRSISGDHASRSDLPYICLVLYSRVMRNVGIVAVGIHLVSIAR